MGKGSAGRENAGKILALGMLALDTAYDLARLISEARCFDALGEAVSVAANEMGFQYFALGRHPRRPDAGSGAWRMHSYPREWEEHYDRCQLGVCDPVHRASHRVASGFRWRDAGEFVPIGERDEAMLDEAKKHGIADGYTIPANIPGEPSGSVTFATKLGRPFPEPVLLYAQSLGAMAFQQGRTIEGAVHVGERRAVTDRQIEVIKWVGRDKTDSEIAQILDVAPCTVTKHIRDSCVRFDSYRRTSLALRAVWAGYLCFTDIFG